MFKKIAFSIFVLFLTIPVVWGQQLEIRITTPLDKARVIERPFISGIVSDTKAEVWVIVHPVEVSDYWVQPQATVKKDGTWRVKAYIGRPGNIDVDKEYEIMAIANPHDKFFEGKNLRGWPKVESRSDVIEVIRKK